MKINLSTNPEDIISTMRKELPSAEYFFHKSYGGSRKYAVFENKLLDKAGEEEQAQITDTNDYISKEGNRWKTYTHVEYYPKACYAQAYHFSFIYYETYGSCGAFFPSFPSKSNGKTIKRTKPNGVTIYTSHFFLRMSERTGIPYRSAALIQEFISTRKPSSCQADEDGCVIVKFKGGYGFGVEKSKSPRVLEIRTFLTEKQLTPKQKKKCEIIDAYDEIVGNGMHIKNIALNTALLMGREEITKESMKKWEAAKKLGIENTIMLSSIVHLSFIRILESILNIKVDEKQAILIGFIAQECSLDFANKYKDFNNQEATEKQKKTFSDDFVNVMVDIAKKLKLVSITREKINEYITKPLNSQ